MLQKKAEKLAAIYFEAENVRFCPKGKALAVVLEALKLSPEDEILISANVISEISDFILNRAVKPIFTDINPENFTPSEEDILAKLGKKIKAVIISHAFGQLAPIENVLQKVKETGAVLIEESYNCVGAVRFAKEKIIRNGSSGIGCIETENYSLIINLPANITTENFNLPEAAEAVLCEQPEIERRNCATRATASRWRLMLAERDLLRDIRYQFELDGGYPIYSSFALKARNGRDLVKFLKENGLESSSVEYPLKNTGCPEFESLAENLILLPTEIIIEKQREYCDKIAEFYHKKSI